MRGIAFRVFEVGCWACARVAFLGSVVFGLVLFAHGSGLVWPGLAAVSGLLAILVVVVLDCIWCFAWVC